MKTFLILVASAVCFSSVANAQLTSQNEAKYIATLKAVVNYKIDDEENITNIEKLRENVRFNQKLQKMIAKLQNTRTKNSTNRKVYDILLNAGKEVYNALD